MLFAFLTAHHFRGRRLYLELCACHGNRGGWKPHSGKSESVLFAMALYPARSGLMDQRRCRPLVQSLVNTYYIFIYHFIFFLVYKTAEKKKTPPNPCRKTCHSFSYPPKVSLATSMKNNLPVEVVSVISDPNYKGGALINLKNPMARPSANELAKNHIWLLPFVKDSPSKARVRKRIVNSLKCVKGFLL